MAHTFNSGIDYFGLQTASSNALKVKGSNENRSKQSASGANSYGDIKCVDSWGETADPSAEYEVVSDLTETTFPALGTVQTVEGIENPVVFGSVTLNTSTGNPPTVSASGAMVQSGATQLRSYTLPPMKFTKRHRAQDFLCTKTGTGAQAVYTPIISIKKGANEASDVNDYGLESVSATFPVEITKSMPKGVLANYDLHGGTATAQYTMKWYDETTAPTIALTAAATALGYTMSVPVSKENPEGGYSQYTWTISLPLVGNEVGQ